MTDGGFRVLLESSILEYLRDLSCWLLWYDRPLGNSGSISIFQSLRRSKCKIQDDSSRTTTRRTPREDLLFASILFANPLAIWEEPTRGARHGGEIGVRPRGGSFQSLSGCISPSPQAVSQGHEITGFGWIHARWRTYVRSIGRSVGRGCHQREILRRSRRSQSRYTQIHVRITIDIPLLIFRSGSILIVRKLMKIDRQIVRRHAHSKTAVVIDRHGIFVAVNAILASETASEKKSDNETHGETTCGNAARTSD